MNPPYSLAYDGATRPWMVYGAPPKSKADYAFVQLGMSQANKTVAVLPHGVLFRGAAEGTIREGIIKAHLLRSVIGLPPKLFMHTDIPVAVIELAGDGDGSVCIVNADELCKQDGKLNVMQRDHVRDVLSCLSMRRDVDRLCHVADFSEIERNCFNLNIPRYVDRYEEPEIPDVAKLMKELAATDKEIAKTERQISKMIGNLVGTTNRAREEIESIKNGFGMIVEQKGGQLAWQL